MSDDKTYNDRALTKESDEALPKPQIEIIVDGNSVFKPSMKTYFVDEYDKSKKEYESQVMGTYCSCDMVTSTHTVCTCNTVATPVGTTCTCDAVATPAPVQTTCTCDTVATPTPVETCSCDSVCTCEAVCSCDGYQSCSCESHTSGGGVSCGSPCACVPVH